MRIIDIFWFLKPYVLQILEIADNNTIKSLGRFSISTIKETLVLLTNLP